MSPATTEVARSAQGVRGQLTSPFIPHNSKKHQLTDFIEEKTLIYYRGFFKSRILPKNLRVTLILVLGRVQWGNDSPTSKRSGTTDRIGDN